MDNEKDPQTYAIIGAAMKVHAELGCGFLEAVYQDALEIEFRKQNIPNEREKVIHVFYSGEQLSSYYKADFVCFNSVIVETKAVRVLSEIDEAQVLNYLKATQLEKALLINFASQQLQYKRIIWTFGKVRRAD